MQIKRLTTADCTIAESVFKRFGQQADVKHHSPATAHLEALLANPICYLLAAIDDRKILGFTLAYRFQSFYEPNQTAYLYDIEVLADQRQKGIGRRLIEELLILLKNDGVREVWLGTGTENVAAQKLFSSTGAQKETETFEEFIYTIE